jgi:hypothetical protein
LSDEKHEETKLMMQIIFKYPNQVGAGLATRTNDGKLNHEGFIFAYAIPKKGDELFDRVVAEVLTDDEMLKERTLCAQNAIKAVVVLRKLA